MVNKMNIQEKLIQNYQLVNKADSTLNCYLLDKRRSIKLFRRKNKKHKFYRV